MATNSDVSVAVVGGGIAGLVCSARLSQLGIRNVTVFDTGKHAVGGRCSSRFESINGQLCVFDHSVQYFTANSQRFKKIVDYLERDGAVKKWTGQIESINADNSSPQTKSEDIKFIGRNGMRSVAESLAKLCRVKRPCWVSNLHFESGINKWKVDSFGYFDYLVIAHNGKCAARLTENAGIEKIHRLTQTRFSPRVNPKDKKMTLNSMFVLLLAFEKSLDLPFEGAHVKSSNISWISNNTLKLRENKSSFVRSNSLECWTIISSKELADSNKVPQESIPPGIREKLTTLLLNSFAEITGKIDKLPKVCFRRLQLWGAAVPLNSFAGGEDCIFDSSHKAGICSDWIVSPCVQGAALSGLALADKIAEHVSGKENSTSLEPSFKTFDLEGDIGIFPN